MDWTRLPTEPTDWILTNDGEERVDPNVSALSGASAATTRGAAAAAAAVEAIDSVAASSAASGASTASSSSPRSTGESSSSPQAMQSSAEECESDAQQAAAAPQRGGAQQQHQHQQPQPQQQAQAAQPQQAADWDEEGEVNQWEFEPRVKVFLVRPSVSENVGTGRLRLQRIERHGTHVLRLLVIGDESGRTILNHTVDADNQDYSREAASIINWGPNGTNDNPGSGMALSFVSVEACAEVWNHIVDCRVSATYDMGQDENSPPDGADEGWQQQAIRNIEMGGEMEELVRFSPPPEPEHDMLMDIANSITENSFYAREDLIAHLTSTEYIHKLLALFREAEDLERWEECEVLFAIFKVIFLLNDVALLELLISDELYPLVLGTLEYDPDLPHLTGRRERPPSPAPGAGVASAAAAAASAAVARDDGADASPGARCQGLRRRHRHANETSQLFQVVPIRDGEIVSRIRQNYRLIYLKDVALLRFVDDNLLATFNHFLFHNNYAIVMHLIDNNSYMVRLFTKVREVLAFPAPGAGHENKVRERDRVFKFLRELVDMAKTFTVPARQEIYNKLRAHSLFSIIATAMRAARPVEQPKVWLACADIVYIVATHDPSILRAMSRRHLSRATRSIMGRRSMDPSDDGPAALIEVMITAALSPTVPLALSTQLVDALRHILEPLTMDMERQRETFLDQFYAHHAKLLLEPLKVAEQSADPAATAAAGKQKKKAKKSKKGKKDRSAEPPSTPVAAPSSSSSSSSSSSAAFTTPVRSAPAKSPFSAMRGLTPLPGTPATHAREPSPGEPKTPRPAPVTLHTPTGQQNAQLQACEMLTYCLSRHEFRGRAFMLTNRVPALVTGLLRLEPPPSATVALAVVRFIRTCVESHSEQLSRAIVSQRLLDPIMDLFSQNGARYNMLNSAVIDLVECIIRHNPREMVDYLINKHEPLFEQVDYVGVFRALRVRWEDNNGGSPTETQGSRMRRTSRSGFFGGQPEFDMFDDDALSESFVMAEDDDDDEEEEEDADEDDQVVSVADASGFIERRQLAARNQAQTDGDKAFGDWSKKGSKARGGKKGPKASGRVQQMFARINDGQADDEDDKDASPPSPPKKRTHSLVIKLLEQEAQEEESSKRSKPKTVVVANAVRHGPLVNYDDDDDDDDDDEDDVVPTGNGTAGRKRPNSEMSASPTTGSMAETAASAADGDSAEGSSPAKKQRTQGQASTSTASSSS